MECKFGRKTTEATAEEAQRELKNVHASGMGDSVWW